MSNLKQYILENYVENIRDIAEHGCSSGAGPIYYSETVALYDEYKDDIWDIAYNMADDMGNKNVLEFLGTLNGASIGGHEQFCNLMVWFAFEEICRRLVDNDEVPERWALANMHSGAIFYFDSEEEAEAKRLEYYKEDEGHADCVSYDDYCESWVIQQEY